MYLMIYNFETWFEIRTDLDSNDLSFASTETKYKKPKTKAQNNIVTFGIFHKKGYFYFGFFWNNLTKITVFTKKSAVLVFGFLVF